MLTLIACALAVLPPVVAADVVLTAGAPLNPERLADGLRAYLPEYGVRVAREGGRRGSVGLTDSPREGDSPQEVALVRARYVAHPGGSAGRVEVEISLTDLSTQRTVTATVARPGRDEDLYRTLALKIQALLRATLGTEARSVRPAGSGFPAPPEDNSFPPGPAATGTAVPTRSRSASPSSWSDRPDGGDTRLSPSAAGGPGAGEAAASPPVPDFLASAHDPRPAAATDAGMVAVSPPLAAGVKGGHLSLQAGYIARSFPLNGPWLQGLALTAAYTLGPWFDLALGTSVHGAAQGTRGHVTASTSIIPVTAAVRIRLVTPAAELLAGPTLEVALASVTALGDTATPVRSAHSLMVGLGAEGEGRRRLGASAWLYVRVVGLAELLGQRYTAGGQTVLDMSRLQLVGSAGIGFTWL